MLLRAGATDKLSSKLINDWINAATSNTDISTKHKIKQQIIQLFQPMEQYNCIELVKDNNYNAIMNLILLGKKEQLNETCPVSGTTPLITSIIYENHIIINLLAEANHIDSIINLDQDNETVVNMVSIRTNLVDINGRGPRGLSACHYAAQKGNVEIIGTLLRVGADRNILSNDKNYTAFDIASLNNCHDAMNVLKYNPVSDSICILAKHGDWNGIRSLLLQGVSINSRQRHVKENGSKLYELYSPLIAAVAYSQKDLVKNLLAVDGIDVNIQNQLGQTGIIIIIIVVT